MDKLTINRDRLEGAGALVTHLLVEVGAAASMSEARRLVGSGFVSVNGHAVLADIDARVYTKDLIEGRLVLKVGSERYAVVV